MRSPGSNEFENSLTKCNSLKDLREACSSFKEDITNSLKEPKDLLSSIMVHLELKGEKFRVFESATWEILLTIDSSLTRDDTTQKSLEKLQSLSQFISHCCTFHKYSLTIRKCGEEGCTVCRPVKMSSQVFS
uniref:Uncharacterized protein n=1 Tax=Amphimedon queenslandica TaxID=400682 RepID=A0A1X7UET4_AMPQE